MGVAGESGLRTLNTSVHRPETYSPGAKGEAEARIGIGIGTEQGPRDRVDDLVTGSTIS
jgi:hypothetical protein